MKKLLILLILVVATNSFGQHTFTGKLKPAKDHSSVILYKLNGLNQKYIDNTEIKEGGFSFEIPKGSTTGMYRIIYDFKNNKFLDFIYNKEDVTVEFHPDYPTELVTYSKSEENILFENYIDTITPLQNNIEDLQVDFFKSTDEKEDIQLKKSYQNALKKFNSFQREFEKKATDKLAQNFIVANNLAYPETMIKDPGSYLKFLKQHYYDYIDFNNPVLAKSSVIINKVIEYVMHLNSSNDEETAIAIRKKAIATTMEKINNEEIKRGVIKSLLYSFASSEDLPLVNYLFKNYYDKLQKTDSDTDFKNIIGDKLKISIGNTARNIIWEENGVQKSLYELKGSELYLVVFWSSTCGHCLKEMPMLKKYLDEKKLNLKVIAIGLENEDSKPKWKEETFFYEDFIHVLAMGKYQEKYAVDYDVSETPNFFLLNSDKQIIAKPYDVKAFKALFEPVK